MRLGGPVKELKIAHTADEVRNIYLDAKKRSEPVFVIGGGSNLIGHDDGFNGVMIKIAITGFDDLGNNTFKIGAGEIWDEVVEKTTAMNLSGIEAMSAIPGTVGATPFQNVGAYGQEIADTLTELEAYDTQTDQFVTLQNADCLFGYRTSIFRDQELGRYIITSITIKLSAQPMKPPFYDALTKYFETHTVEDYSPKTIRAAVQSIRADKLPDPKKLPNSGSFFKQPIIDKSLVPEDAPVYDVGNDKFKIPAGWLIDQAGLKGKIIRGIQVHNGNATVLVNRSATRYVDLAAARAEIIDTIKQQYGIILEQEPIEIPH